jgi:AcrR family transcriptional regulator
VSAEPGLRERKKQRTRELIAETSRRLFLERGFDQVTVAEIARAADVSEGTVFNYFPTKEDLFLSRMEIFEEELLEAIRSRDVGESVLAAFGRFFTERYARLATSEGVDASLQAARIITGSPSLQSREHAIVSQYTASLAALFAEESGARPDDVEPWVVANALMGVHRGLLDDTRRQVLAGRRGRRLAAGVEEQGSRALARLERGLGDYLVQR